MNDSGHSQVIIDASIAAITASSPLWLQFLAIGSQVLTILLTLVLLAVRIEVAILDRRAKRRALAAATLTAMNDQAGGV